MWLALAVFEIVCALGLVLPAFRKRFAFVAPVAALGIALEMLAFSGLHLGSADPSHGPMVYWLVVAALCAFVALGRWKRRGRG